MRKLLKFCLFAAVLALLIGMVLRPEYKVVYQLRMSGGDYTKTTVCVVAKHVTFRRQMDRMAEEVIKEHRRINYDTPTDEITLEVYRSSKDFEKGKAWTEYRFLIDGQEARLVPGDSRRECRRVRWFS